MEYEIIKRHAIPEGVESKEFDFETTKSKMAYVRNKPEHTRIIFLKLGETIT